MLQLVRPEMHIGRTGLRDVEEMTLGSESSDGERYRASSSVCGSIGYSARIIIGRHALVGAAAGFGRFVPERVPERRSGASWGEH